METPNNLIINADCTQAVNEGEEIPDEFEVEGEVFRVSRHATDAWRGYYEADTDGVFKKLTPEDLGLAGWMTADWSDAPMDARESTVHDVVWALCEEHPENTYLLVFLPSSNVFATYYDLFVREP